MIYLKTIFYISFFLLFINSPIFVNYYDIKYFNLLLMILPIIGIIFFYNIFRFTTKRRINPKLFNLYLNSNLALLIAVICNVMVLKRFDLMSFLIGNIAEIRDDFNEFNVSITDQLLPILLVYPFSYVMWAFVSNKIKKDWKFYTIVFFIILFGLSTGGRAFIFIFLLLYIFIARPKIFSVKYLPFVAGALFLFAFITIGRINKNLSFNKVSYFEASAPLIFSEYLKDDNINTEVRDFVVEIVFYFGQSTPAFCNKVENLEFTLLPRSVWGLQPFVERQLIRFGVLQHDQNTRYLEMLKLSNNTGFFATSWSTTFLDVYFHEGIIFSGLFFLMVAVILFFIQRNLIATNEIKFRILTGFNVVFIITFFLSPAFMDTTCFFSYALFFFCNNKDSL
jgi:hypothetical protein